MSKEQREREKLKFVEEVGLAFEQFNIPRMAGRLLGWLLICEPPHQSMNELAEALEASKASISNTTRLLIETGLIERVSLPEFRYDHYRIRHGAWYEITRKRIATATTIRRLADRGLKLLEGEDPDLTSRLEEMRAIYLFFEAELPALLERWRQAEIENDAELEVTQ